MSAADKPAKPIWPHSTLEDVVRRVAASTIPLLLYPRRWVHRRVETLDFVDITRLRRRMSIDFTVPNRSGIPVVLRTGQSIAFVPIALLSKRVLRNFDVR